MIDLPVHIKSHHLNLFTPNIDTAAVRVDSDKTVLYNLKTII